MAGEGQVSVKGQNATHPRQSHEWKASTSRSRLKYFLARSQEDFWQYTYWLMAETVVLIYVIAVLVALVYNAFHIVSSLGNIFYLSGIITFLIIMFQMIYSNNVRTSLEYTLYIANQLSTINIEPPSSKKGILELQKPVELVQTYFKNLKRLGNLMSGGHFNDLIILRYEKNGAQKEMPGFYTMSYAVELDLVNRYYYPDSEGKNSFSRFGERCKSTFQDKAISTKDLVGFIVEYYGGLPLEIKEKAEGMGAEIEKQRDSEYDRKVQYALTIVGLVVASFVAPAILKLFGIS